MPLSDILGDLKTRKKNLDAQAKTMAGDKSKEKVVAGVGDAIKALEPLSKQYDTLSKGIAEASKVGGKGGAAAVDKKIDEAIRSMQSAKDTLKNNPFYIKKQLETVGSMVQDLVKLAAPVAEAAQKAGDLSRDVKKFNDDLGKASDRLKGVRDAASGLRGKTDTKQSDFGGVMADVDRIPTFKLKPPDTP